MLATVTVFASCSCGNTTDTDTKKGKDTSLEQNDGNKESVLNSKYKVICLKDEDGNIASGFNENMTAFHMTLEKTTLLAMLGAERDMPEFWDMTVEEYAMLTGEVPDGLAPDTTLGEYYGEYAVDNAKQMIAAEYLYDIMKDMDTPQGKLIAESDKKLEAQVDNLVSQMQLSLGSKEDFESFITGLGITLKDFRKYYEMSQKKIDLGKVIDVSEEEKIGYFVDNYVVVKHILVNTAFKYNDEGTQQVQLTQEEIDAKKSELELIEARLSAGETFEEIYNEYNAAGKNDDPGVFYNPDGYLVSESSSYVPEFKEAALDMEIGEVRTVETDYGYHVMMRCHLDPERYNESTAEYNSITSTLTNKKLNEMLKPYIDRITVDTETLDKYTIASVPMMIVP